MLLGAIGCFGVFLVCSWVLLAAPGVLFQELPAAPGRSGVPWLLLGALVPRMGQVVIKLLYKIYAIC